MLLRILRKAHDREQWVAETQRERKALEQQLGQHLPGGKLTAK